MANRLQHVYLMGALESNGFTRIKIGIADNPATRADQLQTGHDGRLMLAGSYLMRDAESMEKFLHYVFKDKRIHGEWFDLSDVDTGPLGEMLKNCSLYCPCDCCDGTHPKCRRKT